MMENDLIFDLGLHKGEDSEFYLKKGFRVVGVDASEELCEYATRRLTRYIDNGCLEIHNYAISECDGDRITFYKNISNSVWGTTDTSWAKRNKKLGADSIPITVKTTRLDTLIKKIGVPYYLKVDIEGMDFPAVRQLKNIPDRPRYLSIESEKVSWVKLVEECSFLKQLGYSKFKIVDQRKVVEQTCPEPAGEGKFVDHVFEDGSSGLFGNELPGRWMSFDECIASYRKIFRRYKYFGDGSLLNNRYLRFLTRKMGINIPDPGWYDTHATF